MLPMIGRFACVLVLALACFATVASAGRPALTFRQARTDVGRDLRWHYGTRIRVSTWGCRRRSTTAIRCDTEFARRAPTAVCVARFDVRRRARAVAVILRAVRSLFGTRCRPNRGKVRAHAHVRA